jgi:type II secretory pathway component PulF
MSRWPQAGRDLVNLANLIQSWWWIILLMVVAVILILRRLMTHYTGDLRPVLDTIPPFSIYRRFIAARMLETLGLLVANGIVFKAALRVMQYQAEPYLSYHLTLMEHLLGSGKTNIADVLGTGLVDSKLLMRLKVMAEVKGFEHGLVRMGIRGTEDATATVKLVSRTLGGILLIIGALLILLIVRGIYLTGMAMGTGT